VKDWVFQLDLGMASLPDWASEISFCVFVASGSEMESVKPSCVLANLLAMGWVSVSSLSVSDAYVVPALGSQKLS
jgi:hypothetical protein